MRLRPWTAPILLAALAAACNPAALTSPALVASGAAGSASDHDQSESSCTVSVHAILHESEIDAVVGQVHFRIHPPEPGSDDPSVEYRGVYGPVGGPVFGVLEVSLVSRLPDDAPRWSDSNKSDPGTTLASVAHFGRTVPMSQDMALALIDNATNFKAVVNVIGATGGREAEGEVEPETRVPERLRHKERACFGG